MANARFGYPVPSVRSDRHMNCRNCGAPLSPAAFSETTRCCHCDTQNDVSRGLRGADRIVWSSDPADMDCPRCAEPLVHASVDDHRVKACPECQGMILTTAAFGSLVRQRRSEFRGADRTPHPLNLDDLSDPIYCPECRWTMEVHPYYGPGNQIIDSCVRCGLVWIDSGEITAIEHAAGRR